MTSRPTDTTPLLRPPPLPSTDKIYTVDDAIEHLGVGRFQKFLLFLAGVCWTAESMEMLILSFIKLPLQCAWRISDAHAALITTAVATGMLSGATSWGIFADRFGRKRTFILSIAFTFFFGLASAIAPNYFFLLLARGLTGFGIGGVPVSFSLLMEFLPASVRGRWGLALAAFWAMGAVFESLVALVVVPAHGWRWLVVISSTPLGIMLILSWVLVESPRWLIAKGMTEQAKASLQAVAKHNGKELPEGELNQPISDSSSSVSEIMTTGARSFSFKIWTLWFVVAFLYYGHILLQPEMIANENSGARCSYVKGVCAQLGQSTCIKRQMCSWTGLHCVASNTVNSARVVDYCMRQLTRPDYVSTLWASVGELPGLMAASLVIDGIGRRPLLGYAYGLCALSFLVLLTCTGRNAETLLFFMARGASCGAFQAIYVYTNELYPSTVRATAMGLSSSMSRAGLMLTPFVAQYLENFNHGLAMWIYFTMAVFALFVAISIPIETTQRPLITSMQEFVALLQDGDKRGDMKEVRFSNDPSVSGFVRFFRWNAKIDGNPLP